MQKSPKLTVKDRGPEVELSLLNRIEERSQALVQELRANRRANVDRSSKGQRQTAQQTENMSPEDSKKQRRKLNKKKRNKRIQMLKQGMNELKGIFDRIYYMGCHFEELKEEIALTIEKIPNKTEFLLRINQLIYEYAQETCQYLWEEQSRILTNIEQQYEALCGKIDVEKLKLEQTRRYKIDFTTAIYEEFYVIKTASEDIDKIYDAYYEKNTNEGRFPRIPVYKTTFNYLFDHDMKLKDQLYEFLNYFRREPYRDEQVLAKLQQIVQAIDDGTDEHPKNDYSTVSSEDKPREKVKQCSCKLRHHCQDFVVNYKSEQALDQQLLEQMAGSSFGNRLECTFEDSFLWAVEIFIKKTMMSRI